ncbi:zinc finger protein VAR3, chloroplastic isoform X2 [Hevea brasiliensis]|uniref:zinc finger protein VAR3, chloroplastic isoform X2 n=1 Tax=Hevea brasiliensis TaxID=3981 RepID=UPI0025E93A34|nr:zinc finger protein VAR3, chloroplastic isoform X2 [Hevea brasiliensis]
MGGATRFLLLLTSTPPSPLLHRRCPAFLSFSRHRQLFPSSSSYLPHHHYRNLPSSLSHSLGRPLKIEASHQLHTQTASANFTEPSSSLPRTPHPWPEYYNLIHNLSSAGYFNRHKFGIQIDLEFVAGFNLPEDLADAATACLAFARERPDLLGMLSRKDIEVVVEQGMPFLFKNGDGSRRRMRSFLGSGDSNNTDRAHTIDLMRFLLSYANNLVSSEKNDIPNRELVESSVRNLLSELAQLSYAPASNLSVSGQNQFPDRYGQAPRPLGQNIEMKRGDWICPRCNFMNFARNVKCLECEEARPKRQLTGGEWECPQCDFFNYARNMVCLRCDCKKPGEVSFGTNSGSGLRYANGSNTNKADVDSRLAANEEKAQRWFSKISQLDSSSDMSSAIADEDFPEIMPLRKGVNRFVVSTRKTPLERRLANAQYRRNLGNDGTFEGGGLQSSQSIKKSLDEMLGHDTAASESDNKTLSAGQNAGTNAPSSATNSTSPQYGAPRGSNYVPFVPLPADMFAKKPDELKMGKSDKSEMDNKCLSSSTCEQAGAVSGRKEHGILSGSWQPSEKPVDQTLSNEKEKEQAEKSERWFKRVAELHNVTDLASAISDEDFPEIMPMRKGENRFVVSKRKDRSLTSPMYKRRMAMEQANDTNFVPFVPFPPNYFAKKDNQQPDVADSTNNATSGNANSATLAKLPEKLDDSKPVVAGASHVQGMENQQYSTDSRTWENSNEMKAGVNSTQTVVDPQSSSRDGWSSGYPRNETISETPNLVGSMPQNFPTSPINGKDSGSNGFPSKEDVNEAASLTKTTSHPSENQKIRDSWTGKSLEGSAVKEPDPLDMSEEAKAERWFRRVAQIKDISELSQIPDEDFPSIMPMRKGVNRFVVSKRKTPLERRLTSTQYRRNLPIVNSDPVKERDSS